MVTRSLFLIVGLGALVALGCERTGLTGPLAGPALADTSTTPETGSPSLAIAGPSVIAVKGSVKYTAAASHFLTTPRVVWSERFCNDASDASCSPWTESTGAANTYTRTLGPDCSTPERNYQLRATARAGSQIAVATKRAFLCGEAPALTAPA